MKEIIEALLKAQKEMGNAIKGANNPFFKSKYADLNSVREAVMPLLNENGILVLQPIVHIDGKNFVKTILMHESGQTIESFTEILFKVSNDPQAQGSGITYARRYGLQSLVCIGADDDDGNRGAQEPKQPTPPVKKEPVKPSFLDKEKAIKEMDEVKSLSEITVVWKKYVGLQSDVEFIESTRKAGLKYPKTEQDGTNVSK